MALAFVDRLLTVVVTATVTSAAWIIAGGVGLAPWAAKPAAQAVRSTPATQPSAAAAVAAPAPGASPVLPVGSSALIIPVAGIKPGQLTDTFNDTRSGGRPHLALDIMAPAGTPVVAAADGTVEKLFLSKAGGNTIYVRTPDRLAIHYYAHLQEYAPGLHEGQAVRQGEVLGKVGSTGDANPAAPHLHFQILRTSAAQRWWDPTTPVNPYPLLRHNSG